MYDELGKECIPEDHNTAQTPEIAFVQEQRTDEPVSRVEETTRWIGHLQRSLMLDAMTGHCHRRGCYRKGLLTHGIDSKSCIFKSSTAPSNIYA